MDMSRDHYAIQLQDTNANAYIMRQIPYVVWAGVVLQLSMYRPIIDYVEDGYIVNFWMGLVFSILFSSWQVYRLSKKKSYVDPRMDTYLIRMLHVNAMAYATAWVCMLLMIYMHATHEYQLLLIVLAAGISVGALSVLVMFKYVFMIVVTILLLPFVIAQLIAGDGNLVAGLLSLFWVLLMLSVNKLGETIRVLLYLKEENIDLVHRMADANIELEEFNRELQEENLYRQKSIEIFREKSKFLERIMDATSDGIIVFDMQGMLVRLNPKVCSISGYRQEELLGRHYADNIFPDSDPDLMGMVHTAMKQMQNYTCVPSWLMSKSRELKELQASVSVLEEQGGVSAIVCTLVDMTKEKEMERLKDEFVSNVSHELRTPLTSIHGSLRLLESGVSEQLSEKMRKMLSIAVSNSRRLMGMIDELLDVSKFRAGGTPHEFEICSSGELTREAVDAIQGYAVSHRVNLELKTCIDVFIRVDKKRFIQVLFNLISNAIKYTPTGMSVVVDMFMHGTYLRIQVKDQGEGIAEVFQPYLFERYRQDGTDPAPRQAGSGLGLNIARQMIESMGGHIAYKTDMGHGSSFFIDIPPADTQ